MCHGAKTRDYFCTEEWLKDAGIINISYNLKELELPFSGYELSDYLEFIGENDEKKRSQNIIY